MMAMSLGLEGKTPEVAMGSCVQVGVDFERETGHDDPT